MDKVMTAEELYNNFYNDQEKNNTLDGAIWEYKEDIINMMNEFAKLHVQAALKAANNNALLRVINNEEYRETEENKNLLDIYENGSDTISISQNSILTAYPLENIK